MVGKSHGQLVACGESRERHRSADQSIVVHIGNSAEGIDAIRVEDSLSGNDEVSCFGNVDFSAKKDFVQAVRRFCVGFEQAQC